MCATGKVAHQSHFGKILQKAAGRMAGMWSGWPHSTGEQVESVHPGEAEMRNCAGITTRERDSGLIQRLSLDPCGTGRGGSVFTSWGCPNKVLPTGGLETTEVIPSQFWRRPIGVGRATLSLKALGEHPSLPLVASGGSPQSLACRFSIWTSAFIITWHSACVPASLLLRTPVTLD